MRKLLLTIVAALLALQPAMAQTLFTFGGTAVPKTEFLRVYQKNSLNKAPDMSEAALHEYMELYSLFRMKVKEAELQHLDTLQSIQRELDNYRKQLAKNYLTDEQVNNTLIREAYDRMKEERQVAHILIRLSPTAPSADTMAPYKTIDSIYNAITKKGADFSATATALSQDEGTKSRGGNLGYMTALQTVYDFENQVYNTQVGKVSRPFRTQFGYHIVKVMDSRPARGEVQVAQIMIATPKAQGQAGVDAARKRADSVVSQLHKGAAFGDMVKKYSDDKYSVDNEGIIQPFGVGRMVPVFENAAFGLKKPGDISEPIQTDFGFHIIKLIKKDPIKPYDSMSAAIKKKVENDSRAQRARTAFMDKLKKKNNFKEYPEALQEVIDRLAALPDTGRNAGMFTAASFSNMNKPVFSLAGKNYLQSDMMAYAETLTRGRMMGPRAAVARDIYNMYTTTVLNDFQEHQLVEENSDFRNLMQEYRDGIMLFELMDRNVWGKASRDTVGLKKFYATQTGKYMWEPGFTGSVYTFKNEAAIKEGLKLLAKSGTTDEAIIKQLNNQTTPDAVSIQSGHYEFSRFTTVSRPLLAAGKVSAPIKNADGTYTVVKVDDIYEQPTPKTLDEARGYAVAEYQDHLEKEWNAEMRAKYPVKLDEKVFMSMVK